MMKYGDRVRIKIDGVGYKLVMLINTREEDFPIGVLDMNTYTILDSFKDFKDIEVVDIVKEMMKVLVNLDTTDLTYFIDEDKIIFGMYDDEFKCYIPNYTINYPTKEETERMIKLFEALLIEEHIG